MQFLKRFGKGLNKELQVKNFGFEYNHVHLFYKSLWQKNEVSTYYLLYRWIWALFFLAVYITCIILQFCEGKFFIYMTNWGFGLITITMLISAVMVTRWHYDLQNVRSLVNEAGQKGRTTWGLKIYWWLYNMSLLLALIISTIYWIFLNGRMNKPARFPAISAITHALNSIFILIDFMVVAFPLRLLHMVQTMVLAIVFFLFTLIYHLYGGTDEFNNHYVYPILDWNNPMRCLVTFIGVFLMIVCYWLILFGLHKLKQAFNRAFSVVWTPHSVGLI
ncbi:protein rolling stone isoform X1 [Drosophila sulfurigaster albostrigata]|uniref:protein rolling stone isoform X1 n=1 Tax=Drosophila sulfurigaster albostrigata TaxID=89887 RepID=UPI002D21E9FC|nr:protein rolling stone isoform X1 [Drosophila sulfurigaster albostrigata]